MMSEYGVLPFIKRTAFIICFSVVFYLTIKEIVRYNTNDDSSSISYKKFNDSPKDKYPVITLCFYGRYGQYRTIYKQKNIEKSGLSVLQYREILIGKSNSAPEINDLPNFSSATIALNEMIRKIATFDDQDKAINKWSLRENKKPPSENNSLVPILNSSYWPGYVSYQNPNQICYTQYTRFEKGFVKSVDLIHIDSKMLDELLGEGFLYFYVHYPGQTIRNFGREVFSIMLRKKYTKKRIAIRLSDISILRRRANARQPCEPNMKNEDDVFRNDVVSRIGCIPPYWTTNETMDSKFGKCTSSSQLQKAYYYSRYENVKYILGKHPPPCTEMTVSSSVDMQGSSQLKLHFQYRTNQYLEITNKRDFSARNLWSSVGGYVGIFLGYSLLQLPGILIAEFHWLTGVKRKSEKS